MNAYTSIRNAVCFTHPEREAVALCLACNHFFCRECITEHQGKVLCKVCLAERGKQKEAQKKGIPSYLKTILAVLCGFLLLYSIFYTLGHTLSKIPDIFHTGVYLEQK